MRRTRADGSCAAGRRSHRGNRAGERGPMPFVSPLAGSAWKQGAIVMIAMGCVLSPSQSATRVRMVGVWTMIPSQRWINRRAISRSITSRNQALPRSCAPSIRRSRKHSAYSTARDPAGEEAGEDCESTRSCRSLRCPSRESISARKRDPRPGATQVTSNAPDPSTRQSRARVSRNAMHRPAGHRA